VSPPRPLSSLLQTAAAAGERPHLDLGKAAGQQQRAGCRRVGQRRACKREMICQHPAPQSVMAGGLPLRPLVCPRQAMLTQAYCSS